VIGDEVARGGVSLRGESIDQASDAHGSLSRWVDAMRDRSARWAVAGWTPGRGGRKDERDGGLVRPWLTGEGWGIGPVPRDLPSHHPLKSEFSGPF
jgi:hypothetical protein